MSHRAQQHLCPHVPLLLLQPFGSAGPIGCVDQGLRGVCASVLERRPSCCCSHLTALDQLAVQTKACKACTGGGC
eukprot:1159233-Pelagomonas_calceolata.AAC.3